MTNYIFTCEHGGNKIPAKFKPLFKNHEEFLKSHRGYDIGILPVFKIFADQFTAPFYYSEISRLLIELNRSLHHPKLFSEITNGLNKLPKRKLIDEYYLPYRSRVESKIIEFIKMNSKLIHISFHSFTPELNGNERNADIGLLYDPKSELEKNFCRRWKEEMNKVAPGIKVRLNYPYPGIADGFTSHLRKKFDNKFYVGIELEVNQKLVLDKSHRKTISDLLISSFKNTTSSLPIT